MACEKTHKPQRREVVIEVKGLTVERSRSIVIDNASFKIHKGDYVGMVGPNGGGKTTILKAILGTIPIRSGRVKLFGQEVKNFKMWDRIAYLSQSATNYDEKFPISVRELVTLGRINKRKMILPMKNRDKKLVSDTLDFLGIGDIAEKRIGQLSGGQKQRVILAKVLVREPSLLILDEPTTGVDSDTLERFYKVLSDLNRKRGITILMVSHDLAAVFCRMTYLICVNKKVRHTEIGPDMDSSAILKETYGDHFNFVYHRHNCKGAFNSD